MRKNVQEENVIAHHVMLNVKDSKPKLHGLKPDAD